MKPKDIYQKASEVIAAHEFQENYGSAEYQRNQEAVAEVNARASDLYRRWSNLSVGKRNQTGITARQYLSPDSGYIVHTSQVRSLEFTVDAHELDASNVPEGYQATKTIKLSLFDPVGYEIHKPTVPPPCSVLTSISLRLDSDVETPWSHSRDAWPIQGMQFLEDSDGITRIDQGGLKPGTLEATKQRELTTPREAIVAGIHVALDLLEAQICGVAQTVPNLQAS